MKLKSHKPNIEDYLSIAETVFDMIENNEITLELTDEERKKVVERFCDR